MKRPMKENVVNVNVGNAHFCAPQKELWDSFSKPVRDRQTMLKEDDWVVRSGVVGYENGVIYDSLDND